MTLPNKVATCIIVGMVILAGNNVLMGDSDTIRPYRLKLLGPYAVERLPDDFVSDQGPVVLGECSGLSSVSVIVPAIESYAVWQDFIVGVSRKGHFIYDTANGDTSLEAPEFFESPDEWKTALEKLSIPRNIKLLNPDNVAATRPAWELRPREYITMKGLFGLSDDSWAGVFIILATGVSFLLGIMGMRSSIIPISVGLIVGAFAWSFLSFSSTAPGGGIGLIILVPLFCVVAAYLGRVTKWFLFRITARPVS